MKGWQILKHSLRQVFGNLNGAIRVSAVLYAAQALIGLILGAGFVMQGGMGPVMMNQSLWIGLMAAVIIAIFTSLWIAVSWHRYVLLGEEAGFVPVFRGDRIWAYLVRSFGYGIILVIAGMVWGTIVAAALGPVLMGDAFSWALVMAVLVYLPVLIVGFRLTADVASMAVGAEVPFLSGWRATAGHTKDIAVMVVILIAIGLTVEMLGLFIFGRIPVINLIWSFGVGWLQMMIGVSILTTLYGHYIEKRELI